MRIRLISAVGCMLAAFAVSPLAAQTPALSDIETPYPALQSSVHMAGTQYGPGAVAYGPVNTPIVISGSNLGSSGTALFPGPLAGTTVQASVTSWSASILILTVPSGATSGLVKVVTQGKTSSGLPFMVTPGTYAASCSSSPPPDQLEITTSSLPNATLGTAYTATLSAQGGQGPYAWSLTSGSLLPAGLSLATSTGAITGAPTALGTFNFSVQVSDSSSQTKSTALSIVVGTQTLVDGKVYSYLVPTLRGYDPVGNVTEYIDSVMGDWKFSYDNLNRLSSGVPQSGSYSGQKLCMAYDSFGNRTESSLQQNACSSTFTATAIYNSANRVTWTAANIVVQPDAAGNIAYDSKNSYAYDGEGRLCAVQYTAYSGGLVAVGYIYDAEGRRVAKGNITPNTPAPCNPASNGFSLTESYVLGQDGEKLTTLDQSSNWVETNVYGGAELLATYNTSGLHFHLTDPLGTRRVQTNALGQPELDCQSLPFGDGQTCYPDSNASASPSPTDATSLHFTGKARDSEPGNDYFGARYYNSSMGRFMSPDWSATEQPIPYAKLGNPQSLNLYAYVFNNPTTATDPDGHEIRKSIDGDTCPLLTTVGCGPGIADIAKQQAEAMKKQQAAAAQQKQTLLQKAGGAIDSFMTAGSDLLNNHPLLAIGLTLGLDSQAVEREGPALEDEIESLQMSASETWGKLGTLTDHFERHGADFGSGNAGAYADEASQFFQRAQQEGLPTKIDSSGTIRVYDPATNTFGAYNANGTTKTFFKPTSPNYWTNQPGVLIP